MLSKEVQSTTDEWSLAMQKCCAKLNSINFETALKKLFISKDEKQIDNIKYSCYFTNEWTQLAIKDIEEWFANDKQMKHYDIATKLDEEFYQQRTDKIIAKIQKSKKVTIQKDSIDIGFSPLVQSGGHYDLRITAIADDQKLEWDLIRIVFCYKYES